MVGSFFHPKYSIVSASLIIIISTKSMEKKNQKKIFHNLLIKQN